jgi:hypothetical protein
MNGFFHGQTLRVMLFRSVWGSVKSGGHLIGGCRTTPAAVH